MSSRHALLSTSLIASVTASSFVKAKTGPSTKCLHEDPLLLGDTFLLDPQLSSPDQFYFEVAQPVQRGAFEAYMKCREFHLWLLRHFQSEPKECVHRLVHP